MTQQFSEDEVVASVTRLTRGQLVRFMAADFVKPRRDHEGHVFRTVDIARLELLCDLSVDLDLDDIALGIVLTLLDQLHAARRDLEALSTALDALPADLRRAVTAALKQSATPD